MALPENYHRLFIPQPNKSTDSGLKTLNSKAVGRLLAAGGIYNGNIEGFRGTAEKLGGDAPAGYQQVMDNKGLLIAGASIAAGLTMGRMRYPELEGLEHFGARGAYTSRPFDPDKAGGPIEHLTTEGVNITHEGIAIVEKHISRFDPGNEFMVSRLKKIANGNLLPEQVDLNYYTPECREYQRYCNLGWETGRPADNQEAYDLWNNTHTSTLEDYRITGNDLYHPDAPSW
ncbi:HNH endonuclease [Salmonella enterica subsp. salamae]|nr:HNH endonuclease [Salmonella enterica subsp. salamae]ECI3450281.1 HNH endonuclease [Salmonella enterica subsp. salamae]EEO8342743.1 HNH endonuclease [Salmonella enterica]